MEQEIQKLFLVASILIQRRAMGYRMSMDEKVRFISVLFQYFTNMVNVCSKENYVEDASKQIFFIEGIKEP